MRHLDILALLAFCISGMLPSVLVCILERPPPRVSVMESVQQRLTEHGLESHQTADETVEVDVHVLVGVAHGDDVIQLVVETEA